MTKNYISESGIENIIQTIEMMESPGYKNIKVEDYQVSIKKKNGIVNLDFCKVQNHEPGFSRREFEKRNYSSMYETIKEMTWEATHDGITVMNYE